MTSPSLRLSPRPLSSPPPTPFGFPASFNEQQSLLLPASGRMLHGGKQPLGTGPKLHPDSNKPSQTFSHNMRTTQMKMVTENPPPIPSRHDPPRQGMGTGPAQEAAYSDWVGARVGVYLRIFWKRKGEIFPLKNINIRI